VTKTARRRRGFGTLLILVLVLVLFLGTLAIGHGLFSTSLSVRAHRAFAGNLALQLATNAVTAAHVVVSRAVNTPGTTLFRSCRERTDAFTVTLPAADLPGLTDELARHDGYRLEDDAVSVELLQQHPVSARVPTEYDRFGVLRIRAVVTHDVTGVVRRWSEAYDVKILAESPPRPIDGATFCMFEPSPFVDAFAKDGSANESIKGAVQRLAEFESARAKFQEEYGKLIDALEDVDDEAARAPLEQLRQAVALLEAMGRTYPTVRLEPSGTTDGIPSALHLFPAPPYMLCSTAAQVDLAAVNLPARVQRRVTAIQLLERQQGEAAEALQAFWDGKPKDLTPLPELQRTWCDRASAAAEAYRALLLDDYKTFQDTFVESAGAAYAALYPAFVAMQAVEYASRASAVLREGDTFGTGDERTIGAKFDALLARGDGTLSGVLFVDNRRQTLVLDTTFCGRLTLVVAGPLTIRRAQIADPSRDLVTIVSYGRLDVQGPVQAALVTAGSFTLGPTTAIQGSFVALSVDMGTAEAQALLAGTLVRDERLVSGPTRADGRAESIFADHQYVTVGPYPVATELERR